MFVKCGNKECNNKIKSYWTSKDGLDYKVRDSIAMCVKCIAKGIVD
jgi:hypothetical protein